jgi:hypothetical protein
MALCIYPGGRAVGYSQPGTPFTASLENIAETFLREMSGEDKSLTTVLDGWAQAKIVGDIKKFFVGFNLLTTSAQYRLKSQDPRRVVLLPAWMERDLESLWNHSRPSMDSVTFDEQVYYSGGSAHELLRPIAEIRARIDAAANSVTQATCANLLEGYGADVGAACDSLRRCYLKDNRNIESHTQPGLWEYSVDSAYVLNRLGTKTPLGVRLRSLEFAKRNGPIAHGWSYETFVHWLFSMPDIKVTLHVRPDAEYGNGAVGHDVISLGTGRAIESAGTAVADAREHLGSRTMNMSQVTYWHPSCPTFPTVDAVLCIPDTKTVHYIQITGAKTHVVELAELESIHKNMTATLQRSLQSTDTEGWAFKYVAIEPSLEGADDLKLTVTGQNLTERTVGELPILKGYISYSM